MREKWARIIAYLTGVLVCLLAVFFAYLQNPEIENESLKKPLANKTTEEAKLDSQRIALGMQVYQQQGCRYCHSVNAQGNPRYPLDGIGSKRSVDEIRNWIIGGEEIQGQLSERTLNLKQKHRQLTDNELDSLIYYLRSLEAM